MATMNPGFAYMAVSCRGRYAVKSRRRLAGPASLTVVSWRFDMFAVEKRLLADQSKHHFLALTELEVSMG